MRGISRDILKKLIIGLIMATVAVSGGCETPEPDLNIWVRLPVHVPWTDYTETEEFAVTVNTRVAIHLHNRDKAPQSFFIEGLNIRSGTISPGETKIVHFTPREKGEYQFHIGYTRGNLIVDEIPSYELNTLVRFPVSRPGDTKYYYAFDPDEFTVPADTRITLNVYESWGTFVMEELNVRKELNHPVTSVQFTPPGPGRYEFYIEDLDREGPVGTLIVE